MATIFEQTNVYPLEAEHSDNVERLIMRHEGKGKISTGEFS